MLTHPQVTVGTCFPWNEAKRAVLPCVTHDPWLLSVFSELSVFILRPASEICRRFIEPSFAGREL